MQDPRRFEIAMPAVRRVELERLASELGTSSADLARMAIIRMLNSRDELLGHSRREAEAAVGSAWFCHLPH